MQAPAAICVLAGPSWAYELVNASYQRSFPGRCLLGRPLLEALPELCETSLVAMLKQVYASGETYHAYELPLRLARVQSGRWKTRSGRSPIRPVATCWTR